VTLLRYLSLDESLTKNCSGSSRNCDVWKYISRSLEFVLKETYAREGRLRENVRQVTKMTGKQTCQMQMRLMMLRKQV
jgi:hypothetical protein